jgi:KaiC/GvpD/RAD55 family RecA-like ATPase
VSDMKIPKNESGVKKITTGIIGLDEIFNGGIREKSKILVTGGPGTGKTLLCLQFIYEGARQGQPGIYMSVEETADQIRQNARAVGMDLEPYEKKGLITIIQQNITARKLVAMAVPMGIIRKSNVKRVVVDSLTLFKYMLFATEEDFRRELVEFLDSLKDVTLLATSERTESNFDEIKWNAEDFLFEGLIILAKIRKAQNYERTIVISKMRGQEHSLDIYPFAIEKGGLKVFSKQVPFSLIEEHMQHKEENK